jgi:hypothetical protein
LVGFGKVGLSSQEGVLILLPAIITGCVIFAIFVDSKYVDDNFTGNWRGSDDFDGRDCTETGGHFLTFLITYGVASVEMDLSLSTTRGMAG